MSPGPLIFHEFDAQTFLKQNFQFGFGPPYSFFPELPFYLGPLLTSVGPSTHLAMPEYKCHTPYDPLRAPGPGPEVFDRRTKKRRVACQD